MKKLLTILILSSTLVNISIAGWNPFAIEEKKSITAKPTRVNSDADRTVNQFKAAEPKLHKFFEKAYGYAVFPTVSKAGFVLGGAYGEGYVYRKDGFIGNSTLTQVTVGFQIGGQAYSEIIFFKDKVALDRFISDDFEIGAQASAVLLGEGVSADVDYSDGVAVFTITKGGLMYEAAIGGQKFSFDPR